MKILIQKNLFSERNEFALYESLERFGIDFIHFTHIPFSNEIIFDSPVDKDDNHFIFGSVNSCRILEKLGFKTCFNEKFDFRQYQDKWKEYLLNFDSLILDFNEGIPFFPCFIRPCEDSKLIVGNVFWSKDEWNYTKKQTFDYNQDKQINEQIQISKPKNIYSEIRCFIVNSKVITCSYYRRNRQLFTMECKDDDIIEFVNRRIGEWKPLESFVMDIARIENGLKIVEIGCINCAGFYDCDLNKLLETLIL